LALVTVFPIAIIRLLLGFATESYLNCPRLDGDLLDHLSVCKVCEPITLVETIAQSFRHDALDVVGGHSSQLPCPILLLLQDRV
jgi:hypothetical protein